MRTVYMGAAHTLMGMKYSNAYASENAKIFDSPSSDFRYRQAESTKILLQKERNKVYEHCWHLLILGNGIAHDL